MENGVARTRGKGPKYKNIFKSWNKHYNSSICKLTLYMHYIYIDYINYINIRNAYYRTKVIPRI